MGLFFTCYGHNVILAIHHALSIVNLQPKFKYLFHEIVFIYSQVYSPYLFLVFLSLVHCLQFVQVDMIDDVQSHFSLRVALSM